MSSCTFSSHLRAAVWSIDRSAIGGAISNGPILEADVRGIVRTPYATSDRVGLPSYSQGRFEELVRRWMSRLRQGWYLLGGRGTCPGH